MRNEKTGRLLASKTHGLICKCEQCGIDFKPKGGAKGNHCSQKCWHESKNKTDLSEFPDFYKCTKCLAEIGFGVGVASRLVRKEKGSIAKAWKRCGIKAKLPECGSWRIYAQRNGKPELPWWGDKDAEKAWMSEYNPKFPDWWSIYAIERQRKMSCDRQKELHGNLPKEHPWRLKKVCRTRIYSAIKRANAGTLTRKASRTTQLIGCTMEQLRSHLESKFKPGMTWENHGSGWHIDHIMPCAAFDFTNPDQIFQCFHYTNMQPLWAHENLSKSDKILTTQLNLRLPYSRKVLRINRLSSSTPL